MAITPMYRHSCWPRKESRAELASTMQNGAASDSRPRAILPHAGAKPRRGRGQSTCAYHLRRPSGNSLKRPTCGSRATIGSLASRWRMSHILRACLATLPSPHSLKSSRNRLCRKWSEGGNRTFHHVGRTNVTRRAAGGNAALDSASMRPNSSSMLRMRSRSGTPSLKVRRKSVCGMNREDPRHLDPHAVWIEVAWLQNARVERPRLDRALHVRELHHGQDSEPAARHVAAVQPDEQRQRCEAGDPDNRHARFRETARGSEFLCCANALATSHHAARPCDDECAKK